MRYVAAGVLFTILLLLVPFAIAHAVRGDAQVSWDGVRARASGWAEAFAETSGGWAEAMRYSINGAFLSHSTSEM